MVVPSELNIAENKQPDTMLNRAVENSPQASDEDEIPEDDMYASVALVYTISGTGTEALSIVPATGELRTTRILDFESGDERFEVTVTATDPTDRSDSIDLIINVTDEDEAPVGGGTNSAPVFDSATMTREVAENTDAGMEIGDPIMATDPQDQDITYSLGGEDVGYFDIESMMGQLMTKGALDHEAQSRYTVTVTAMDNDATDPLSSETTVIIMVTDVVELGTLSGPESPIEVMEGMDAVGTFMASGGAMDDTATWTLEEGTDAEHFSITGGVLTFETAPDYENPMGGADADSNEYMVTVKASAGGETDTITVTVMVTDVVELGTLSGPESPIEVAEGMDAVGTFMASGGTKSDTATWTLEEGTDAEHFSITGGVLTFETAPDYENPMGGADADSNTYMVTVMASAGGEMKMVEDVTIEVTDVVELGTLSGPESPIEVMEGMDAVGTFMASGGTKSDTATWTLEEGTDAEHFSITGGVLTFETAPDYENPMGGADADSNTYMVTVMASAGGEMKMVEDVTIEVTDVVELGTLSGPESPIEVMEGMDAVGTFMASGGTKSDMATWTLEEGTDAEHFSITGGVLTFETAPDYENPMGGADADSNTYMVTVMASAGGEMKMVEDVTIEVTDVVELGTLSGPESPIEVMEGMDAVGTFMASGGTKSDTATWTLEEGTDAEHFSITGGVLTFETAPDYENPMGGADADSNTYMVTVMASAGGEMKMVEDVTIEVTDVVELGTLSGPESPIEVMEGMDAVGTFMASGGTKSDTATWTLEEGTDAEHFSITGGVLTFETAPDYENPMGGADADSNTYMVTVMASAGGEMKMVEDVTIEVTDVVELGTLSGPESPIEVMEGMDAVGTFMASGGTKSDMATWTLEEGTDAEHFSITGGVLTFETAPDYENPMGGADADSNTYMVTVMASAGGEMEMMEVTVMVTDVVELGMLTGMKSPSHPENSMDTVATYTVSGGDGTTVNWSLGGADGSHFTLDGTDMSRMLKFKSAPDYEMPRGAAMSDTNTNTYMVTVKAEAGGVMEMVEVTVMVTNEEEDGTVNLSTMSPAVGSEVTASLTDPDGGITGTTWQWSKSMTMDGTFTDIYTATSMAYTPAEADEGYYLKVTASYTDGEGTGKTATVTSQSAVVGVGAVGPVQRYDTNGVEGIQIDELVKAIDDYFDADLSIDDLFEVIDAYFG